MALFLQLVDAQGTMEPWVAAGDFTVKGTIFFNNNDTKGLLFGNTVEAAPYVGMNGSKFVANIGGGNPAIGQLSVVKNQDIDFVWKREGRLVTLITNGVEYTQTDDDENITEVMLDLFGQTNNQYFFEINVSIKNLELHREGDVRIYDYRDFVDGGTGNTTATLVDSGTGNNDISITAASASYIEWTPPEEPTESITISGAPYTNYVYQRDSNNEAVVQRTVTYEGAPSGLKYRLLNAANDTVLQNWITFDSSPSNGTSDLTFTLSVPSTYTSYKIEVAFTDNETIIAAESVPWSIGDIILIFGQSLAYHLNASSKGTPSKTEGYFRFNGTSSATTDDGSGSYEMARAIMREDGAAVTVINVAVGSSALIQNSNVPSNYWSNENSDLYTNLVAMVDACCAGDNRLAGAYWQQGHSEYSQGKSKQEYLDGLNLLMNRVRARYQSTENTTLPLFIATQGRHISASAQPDSVKQGIRDALLTFIAEDDASTQVPVYHHELDDGVHFTTNGYRKLGQEIGLKFLVNRNAVLLTTPKVIRAFVSTDRLSLRMEYDSNLKTDDVYSAEGVYVSVDGVSYGVASYVCTGIREVTINLSQPLPAGNDISVYQGYGNGSTSGQLVMPRSESVVLGDGSTEGNLTAEMFNFVLSENGNTNNLTHIAQPSLVYSSGTNQPPTANAGPDQSVAAAMQFTLDGTGSQDTDGTIVEWRWTQTAGDTVTLDLENPAKPTATSPSKTTAQRLTFQLVTVDDENAVSSPSLVNIDVAAVVQNDVLNIIDKISFTFESDGMITAFPGRANR
ncbi:MAG: sialate O-acetylesterase, partial [Pseudomonadota bacterium]|nr:sialate O-acetylesterase [Pseudomonadota bacterium]